MKIPIYFALLKYDFINLVDYSFASLKLVIFGSSCNVNCMKGDITFDLLNYIEENPENYSFITSSTGLTISSFYGFYNSNSIVSIFNRSA